ncbi:Abi family protein [Moraxella sp. Pampa]|uniref:Abi family protein n=1 Tax=Moraxella sp. Pampa TaxID=3111978 RepID=UPI002B40BF7E|nr:Abi family protein [Moraxella sp. Pampa]
MLTPIKSWKTFEEQADILKQRGLLFANRARLENYLSRIGYYRFSGYLHPFRQWDSHNNLLLDTFMPNSHFEDVLSLYLFDKKLRLLALDALERIETAIKVDIAHLLGEKDPLAHRDSQYFDGQFIKNNNYQKWLEYTDELVQRAKNKSTPFVLHNQNKYGDLPIWVVCNLWDFGAMSKVYSGLTRKDRDKISQKYGLNNGKEFAKWLKSLNEIRNICAHHDRLWNSRITIKSSKIKESFWDKLDNSRPFFYFCVMQKILKVLCPKSQWGQRFLSLIGEFPKHHSSKINLKVFGLIDDYKNWNLWQPSQDLDK